jgi:hypothetical protein
VAIKGYSFITRTGYDPEKGKHIKDPYLGKVPTLGACMPNIREQVVQGDHIFLVSGKVPGLSQFVVGCFEVDKKIKALTAYRMFPEHRLRLGEDGQLTGNIIVDSRGNQHPLDDHSSFARRIENYVIGRNPIVLTEPHEIARARVETMDVLQSVLGKRGAIPRDIMGRCSRLDHKQIQELRDWLLTLTNGRKAS